MLLLLLLLLLAHLHAPPLLVLARPHPGRMAAHILRLPLPSFASKHLCVSVHSVPPTEPILHVHVKCRGRCSTTVGPIWRPKTPHSVGNVIWVGLAFDVHRHLGEGVRRYGGMG